MAVLGIDAPEVTQTCDDWTAGVAAAYADLIRRKAITCENNGQDRYDRSIASCLASEALMDWARDAALLVFADLDAEGSAPEGRFVEDGSENHQQR